MTTFTNERGGRRIIDNYDKTFFKESGLEFEEAPINVDWEADVQSWTVINDSGITCGSALVVRSPFAYVFFCVIGVLVDDDQAWEDIAGPKVRAILEKGKIKEGK